MKAATCITVLGGILLSFLFGASATSGIEAPQAPAFASVQEHQNWVMNTYLPWMEQSMYTFHNVPRADGQLLKTLVEKTKRHHGLEMGASNGYSAIWIGLGMENTQGGLVTIEIEPDVADLCRENIKRAGLEKNVTCVTGDALKVAPGLKGPFDFLFIDIGTMDMVPFIKAAEPKLTPDAIIVLHNLAFASSYQTALDYAASKGWHIQKVKPDKGMGLFLISPSGGFTLGPEF